VLVRQEDMTVDCNRTRRTARAEQDMAELFLASSTDPRTDSARHSGSLSGAIDRVIEINTAIRLEALRAGIRGVSPEVVLSILDEFELASVRAKASLAGALEAGQVTTTR
jgi:hypothetical protein